MISTWPWALQSSCGGAVASYGVLSPYPQLVRAGFRRYATYRQAALAGLTTNVVFGLLRASVLVAVLAQHGPIAGYDVATAVTYVWLGQGLLNVVNLWSDRELAQRVRTGDIVVDLGRPWDLQAALLAADLGRAGHAVLMRLLPPMAFGALFFPFRWPQHAATWPLFAVSMLLAVAVSFGIRFLLNLSAFWLLDARGVLAVWGTVGGLLSGLILPLAWFPAWAQAVLAWIPFPALFQMPIDVFLERGDPFGILARQLAWAAVLFALGRAALTRGTRRLVVQGG
jgi:viologen exporter family transport system permease protein